MKATNLKRQVRRNLAALRLQAPDQREMAWQQYGQPLLEQLPPETWREHLTRVPAIYRDSIRSRLIREAGCRLELTP